MILGTQQQDMQSTSNESETIGESTDMAAELAGVELSDGSDIEDEEDYIQLRTKF
jgi:hypothetical protein